MNSCELCGENSLEFCSFVKVSKLLNLVKVDLLDLQELQCSGMNVKMVLNPDGQTDNNTSKQQNTMPNIVLNHGTMKQQQVKNQVREGIFYGMNWTILTEL